MLSVVYPCIPAVPPILHGSFYVIILSFIILFLLKKKQRDLHKLSGTRVDECTT